ncbi:thermosome subunit alpha [Haloferax sp. DFSO52]|uniref:thermosome subunit alpha n=1 Tax=Haloferax sp. DFSO52 TaxID=3388505 RepID=UPI003A88483B
MIILGEDSQRVKDRDAQTYNIRAARAVAEAVRSTLGPKGMDKMLVDSSGDVIITNDGVTILREMDIDNPTANMVVEIAETQETEVGDGTTTAVIIAGELLDQAEDLIESDIHPTTIVQGYRLAAEKAKGILKEIALKLTENDRETLLEIATTAMTGKGAESAKDLLAGLVVDAVLAIQDDEGIDTDNISVEKVVGGSINNSELVEGVIVDKTRVDENMPYAVEDANVALLADALEVQETKIDAEVNVTDPDQFQQFLDQEEKQLKEMVDKLVEVGADVVFVGDGINDMAQHYLAKEGILAVHHVTSADLKHLARATGGRVVSNLDDIEEDDLGFAGSVAEKDVGGDERIFVEGVEDAKSVTLILRGSTQHVVDELERAIEDALGVVRTTLEDGEVLPGGGAAEIELSIRLREFANSVGGREQLAIEAFADALDVIPRTLAKNAGLDPIDTIVDLRTHHTGVKAERKDASPTVSPTEIMQDVEYFESIFVLGEIAGLPPSEIQSHVDAAAAKSPAQIQEELGSIDYYLTNGELNPETEQLFREIVDVKMHLVEYCSTITDSPDSIEQLDETLSEDEFESGVAEYVKKASSIDRELGYDVDQVTKWFYRRKQECYLQQRYQVEIDQEQLPGFDPSQPNRDYHEMFGRKLSLTTESQSKFYAGIDAHSAGVGDMVAKGIIEPLRLKTQAIDSATEAAVMILRIDDVISAGDLSVSQTGDDGDEIGGMGGMGGMGGAM